MAHPACVGGIRDSVYPATVDRDWAMTHAVVVRGS
jgi:hypothetical protein